MRPTVNVFLLSFYNPIDFVFEDDSFKRRKRKIS